MAGIQVEDGRSRGGRTSGKVVVNIDRLRELAEGWRADAVMLRKRGAAAQAEALESCAADHEQVLQEWQDEELTLHEAAEESGFSYSRLQQLKDLNVGTPGSPRIRRCDLPSKPRRSRPKATESPLDLADGVLLSRLGG